jgi:hypothetical protein
MIFFIGESFGDFRDFASYFELGKYVAATLSSFLSEHLQVTSIPFPSASVPNFLWTSFFWEPMPRISSMASEIPQ